MIVRVSGEGQFELPDEDAERLNELDNRAVDAVEQGDEAGFRELWSQMLELVASDGNAIDEDELVESDVILPPRDVTLARPGGVHGRRADPGGPPRCEKGELARPREGERPRAANRGTMAQSTSVPASEELLSATWRWPTRSGFATARPATTALAS